jgi:hypothetical protein
MSRRVSFFFSSDESEASITVMSRGCSQDILLEFLGLRGLSLTQGKNRDTVFGFHPFFHSPSPGLPALGGMSREETRDALLLQLKEMR